MIGRILSNIARDRAKYNDGLLTTWPTTWMRQPGRRKLVGQSQRKDQDDQPMVLVRSPGIPVCPDSAIAGVAGGARLKSTSCDNLPRWCVPVSVCRRCQHRVRSKLYRRRYSCALLRELRDTSTSPSQAAANALSAATQKVGEWMR